MLMGKLIAPVVIAGAMADTEQPVIAIDEDLELRPFLPTDAAAVVEAFSDPDIQHWHFRRYDTEAEAQEWIASCAEQWRVERGATWAIDHRSTGVVGRVAIYTELQDGHGEVSYWVLPRARGRGVATRACVTATRWAHSLGLHRVQLQHSVHNETSRRVALRAGFVEEGVRREANLHRDGWHDMRLYAHVASGSPTVRR